MVLCNGGITRAVMVLRRDSLSFRRIDEIEICLRGRAGALLVHHLVDDRDRGLGENRERRRDDLEPVLAEFVDRQIGLVFPRQQHIADISLDEGHRRTPRAGIEHRHVLVEIADEIARLILRAVFLQCVAPRREIVPARAAGGFWIRRDHLDAGLHEVIPSPDALRVALADQEDDRGRIGGCVIGQLLLPVRRDQPAPRDGVDVIGERKGHDVGLQAVDHRARLRARSAVGLLDLDGLAGLGLELSREGLVDRGVELARRIVRHVEQIHVSRLRRADQHQARSQPHPHSSHGSTSDMRDGDAVERTPRLRSTKSRRQ